MMEPSAYLLLSGRWKRIFEMVHPGGWVVYFVIAAPWYCALDKGCTSRNRPPR